MMVILVKDKLGKRIFKNATLMSLYIFTLEMIVRLNTSSHFFSVSLIRIFISSVIFGTLISLIISSFSYRGKNIVTSIIAFLLMIYSWIEINLYSYMGFFMGVGNAEQGTKITDYVKDFVGAAPLKSYLVIIPFIILLVLVWYLFKTYRLKKLEKTIYFIFKRESALTKTLALLYTALALVIMSCLYYSSLTLSFMQNKSQAVPNRVLLFSSDNSNLSVSQFGVFTYGFSDIICNIFHIEVSEDLSSNSAFSNQ